MPIVADYSAGFPGARALKDAGFSGAVRYIGFPRNIKCTNADELKDFTEHGLGMALVFEHAADDWRGGWQAGFNNYRIARAHAGVIGFPADRPIYMAVDSEVIGNADHQTMEAYLRGARDAAGGDPYLVGVYGQYSVCQWLHVTGNVVGWYWQCRAWSGTPIRFFGNRHLFQRVGNVTVGRIPSDINDVSQNDWGQHTEGDMGLTSDESNAVWEMHRTIVSGDYGPMAPGTESGLPKLHEHINFLGDRIAELAAKVETPAPVQMTEDDRAAIILGLAPAVADLLAERLKN